MFPCKQNGEKGIIVVTIIIKPQTHKIHKMDWGGFGNAVSYQRCRLFWTFCTDRAETRTKANLNPTSSEAPLGPWERQHGLLWRRGHESSPALLRIIPPSPQVRLKGSGGAQCEARASLDQFLNRFFINIYKSVTGTWNVFGWNNPTLQDNVFTECPGPGWVQQAMIMVLSVSLRKQQPWD